MDKGKFIGLVIVCGMIGAAEASVVLLQDDFTSSSVTTDSSRLYESDLDGGWNGASTGGGSAWQVTGGIMQNASISGSGNYPTYMPAEGAIGQLFSTGGKGLSDEDKIQVSFDYSVSSGDVLYVQFWGYTGTIGTSDRVGNTESRYGMGNEESFTSLDAFNMLDGATTGFGGSGGAFFTISGGLDGVSGTYTTTVDLGTLGISGVDEVADLSTFMFGVGKDEDGLVGTNSNITNIDNLSVTAVPEPSAAALLGLGSLSLILRRRRS